jgi:orotidine-5'-phosphate decarboxylase
MSLISSVGGGKGNNIGKLCLCLLFAYSRQWVIIVYVPATGNESLIVALDVPTVREALAAVEALDGVVSFFKIGLQLFLTGDLRLLLHELRQKQVFVDLKVPGDIANTISSVIDLCVTMQVRFLTLSESMPVSAIAVAKAARNGSENPKLLTVPFLSSMDGGDLVGTLGTGDVGSVILQRAGAALKAGCDGIIASGQEIRLCRSNFPDTIIVSPAIRPSGTQSDDHKRFTTPKEAILMGSNYLVVGRPILKSSSPVLMAKEIILEIDQAISQRNDASAGHSSGPPYRAYSAAAASAI